MRQCCGNVLTLDRRRRGYVDLRRKMRDGDGKIDLTTIPKFAMSMNLENLHIWTRHFGVTGL